MIHLVKKIYVNVWSIVAMLTLCTSSTLQADPLTPTELHATLGIVTNFILDDTKITHNGTTYGTVTSPYTGKIWLDRNLGATQVCTSFDDVACYGDYYQWGRNADGHENKMSNTTTTIALNVNNVGHGDFIATENSPYDWVVFFDSTGTTRSENWSKIDGSSVCPLGFRVPTLDEMEAELFDAGSAEIQDRDDAFNSFLAFPSAGYRDLFNGSMGNVGSWGDVWLSSADGSGASGLYFNSGVAGWLSIGFRADGFSVRCLKD